MKAGNTKKGGEVTVIFFKEKNTFISVCLELDIVKEGKGITTLRKQMEEAVLGYVETVCKGDFSDALLNRPAPKKYWDKYYGFLRSLEPKSGSRTVRPRADRVRTIDRLPIQELCAA